jgi:3-dehydroquinate synthase
VTNPTVNKLHGETVRQALRPLGCDVATENVPDGEQYKNMQTVESLLERMALARLDRASLVVSLGGGVVGDIAGFAAAIFMRGISYVHVPTTLLAQVDSSIGGKVGVDHPLAKNLVGAFHHPILVCIDSAFLASLPGIHLRNGMAEVIKYGIIADEGLFSVIERNMQSLNTTDSGLLEDVIRRCCQIKARIVQQDPRETSGLRSILNYGHTVGHAVESVDGFTRFTHGEAISIGMAAAAKIARILRMPAEEVEKRPESALSAAGLPTRLMGVETRPIIEAMRLDKKAVGGKLRFVLPLSIGRVVVKDGVPIEAVEEAIEELKTH